MVGTRGERIQVSFDSKGQPIDKEGDELQSWIGVLAREHIPIWIADFRSADLEPRKERVWLEVVTSFTVDESNKKQVLKSCGESAKCFRYDLYQAFVRYHIDEETVWQRPAKVVQNYPTISQDDWERFITYRRTANFKRLSQQGSEIRKKSKYGSTTGRDGYRKRDQEIFEQTGEYAARHVIWWDTRLKLDGEYKNPSIKIIDETILAALERTVQELCAKHGINRETMADEATAPTIDQHNSFKASCTLNEKEADTSNQMPMPNASRLYMDCVPTDTVHGILLGEGNVRVTISAQN
ncbi:hypothetical protein TIFTF001_041418 [Ficus carica]|uniref:Transposase n=1 Tax=Ficus carica TaxID=3494 RepID=A0AA87ZPB9_FICCA|nr:hypothetical protein TIFTF001_041418 [Ficus carica]